MPGELEAPVLRVPHESHVGRPGRDVRQVPRLPVHEAVARRCGRADDSGCDRHHQGGREREPGQAARAEACEQDERTAEDRGAHGDLARRVEERRRPTGSQEEHERCRDRFSRRHEQRHCEREDEDAREHELVHRRMHARVERKMRAVEVVEAVAEPRPEGRDRVRDAEGRARTVEPPRDDIDSDGNAGSSEGCNHRSGAASPAAARESGRKSEPEQQESAPERPNRLLEPQPRNRDDHERGSADRDRPRLSTHAPPPPHSRLAGRRRDRPPGARRRSARPRPGVAGAREPAGAELP